MDQVEWEDRKVLASVFQQHCKLPDGGLTEGFYEAVIAVGNEAIRRVDEENQL